MDSANYIRLIKTSHIVFDRPGAYSTVQCSFSVRRPFKYKREYIKYARFDRDDSKQRQQQQVHRGNQENKEKKSPRKKRIAKQTQMH